MKETENLLATKPMLTAVTQGAAVREIKFRAWDKKNNKMRPQYGVIAKIEWSVDYIPNKIGVYEYVQINEAGDGDWDGFELDKGEFELMQYTGLKDKNGKEIYEGDILKCYYGGSEHGAVEEVEFKDGAFILRHRTIPISIYLEYDGTYTTDIEVIGNIHENAGLLAAAP